MSQCIAVVVASAIYSCLHLHDNLKARSSRGSPEMSSRLSYQSHALLLWAVNQSWAFLAFSKGGLFVFTGCKNREASGPHSTSAQRRYHSWSCIMTSDKTFKYFLVVRETWSKTSPIIFSLVVVCCDRPYTSKTLGFPSSQAKHISGSPIFHHPSGPRCDLHRHECSSTAAASPLLPRVYPGSRAACTAPKPN